MRYFSNRFFIYFTNLYYQFLLNVVFATKNLIISDIDNTIAHTYPTINNGGIKNVASTLSFFPNVIQHIKEMQQETDAKIIFLTVRPISTFFITQKWLKQIAFKEVSFLNLFFAKSATQKVRLLKKVNTKNRTVIFLDDMSYNTENGSTLFYEKEIIDLTNIHIKYIDYKALLIIQDGYYTSTQ